MRISDWSSDVCSSDLYTPHIDTGDYIVIVNAEKVKTTGNKLKNKIYYRHTEYPGGIRSTSLEKMLETHPERVLEKAIKEIGRASCRERVCQYVSISVVAVYLKKKNTRKAKQKYNE